MTTAVCFDLDGTLFDDRQYVRGGLRHAGDVLTDRIGLDLTDALLDAYFERDITESTFDTVLRENGQPTELVPELVAAYHDNNAALSPFPETVPTLETLVDEYRLGVITGGTNGRDKLDRLGLEEYFETVFVSPAYGSSKREPEIFEAALDTLGVRPTETIYVGDRPPLDFPQPNRLGMTTVHVRTSRYADTDPTENAVPDHVINSLGDLPPIVDG